MKTWIIILTILFAVLRTVQTFLANYIRNDNKERLKYKFMDGASTLGLVHGVFYLLSNIVLSVDVILVVILLIGKL